MTTKTIVLAHGILGFGSIPGLPVMPNYFNGVAAHLRVHGHTVIAPQVNPIGSIQQRGSQLAKAILQLSPSDERLHIIAHSMGGLDARYALTHVPGVAGRVKTLVTIGTPHHGSTVADAVVRHGGALFEHVPAILTAALSSNADGLRDLTTASAERFNQTTADVPTVRYLNITGDASRGGYELLLFKLSRFIGQLQNEINDGVVTKTSALRDGNEHLADWPVDHFGEIGWTLQLLPSPEHLARYDAIVAAL